MSNRCAPLGYLQLCARQRPWEGKASVTQLIDGTRRQFLLLTTDFAESPQDGAWRVLGTKAHAGLDMDNSLSFTEEKLEYEGVTGITDLIEQQQNGEYWLIDYKVSGSYKVAKAIGMVKRERINLDPSTGEPIKVRGKVSKNTWYEIDTELADVEDWGIQLNAYRLATEKTLKFDIARLKIHCIVRDGATYVAKQRGIINNFYYIGVPFMRDIVVARYLEEKKDALLTAMGRKVVPVACSEKEAWNGNKCNICPVADTCIKNGNPYITRLQSEEE